MIKRESPFERAAEQMNAGANKISKGREGTDSISEISYCLEEEIIGVYPQASIIGDGAFVDDGGLYFDRFPEPAADPIEHLLEKGAKWTDVLSASLRYRCFLLSPKALEVFQQFELGNVRFYNAIVTDKKKEKADYTYIFICNHVTLDDIDFSRSECFLVDMISQPIEELKVIDKADFLEKSKEANDGNLPNSERFCRIAIGKVQLLPGKAPKSDIFGMSRWDLRIYVSAALRDAILEANISGLAFKQNTRLFL